MSEKTERATPKKVRDARKKGQVAKSAEFTGAAVLFATLGALVVSGGPIVRGMMASMRDAIDRATDPRTDVSMIPGFLADQGASAALAIAPLLAAAFMSAALVSYIQVGALFTLKPVTPDANKLNPAQGLKSLFGKEKAVALLQNLAKLGLMSAIAWSVIGAEIATIARAARFDLHHGVALLPGALFRVATPLVAALGALAIVDLILQRRRHAEKLKMSKDEVKREHKESEGDPMIKGQRRQLHQEMIDDPGLTRIAGADAVVVNPTHLAVAPGLPARREGRPAERGRRRPRRARRPDPRRREAREGPRGARRPARARARRSADRLADPGRTLRPGRRPAPVRLG